MISVFRIPKPFLTEFITASRAGNTHASHSSVAILKRMVRALRQRWPKAAIEIRADAGFAVPALYDYCEREGISYTIALITNERLKEMTGDVLEEAREQHQRTAQKARLFGEDLYGAASWEKERRVIYKAEAMEQGTNRRFVVSTRGDGPKELYEFWSRISFLRSVELVWPTTEPSSMSVWNCSAPW